MKKDYCSKRTLFGNNKSMRERNKTRGKTMTPEEKAIRYLGYSEFEMNTDEGKTILKAIQIALKEQAKQILIFIKDNKNTRDLEFRKGIQEYIGGIIGNKE